MSVTRKEVLIKRYQQDHVLSNMDVLFNVNNLYGDKMPSDYHEKIKRGNTSRWIDLFHSDNYQTLKLDESDLRWMKVACHVGLFTCDFSRIHKDDLEYTCEKYRNRMAEIKASDPIGAENGWFIRVESVSLKYGKHGPGPYRDLKEIIESLVTSSSGHECIKPDDIECTIYFMRWQSMDPFKEFRIFVHQNRITAISDQHLHVINKWLNTKSDDEISDIVNIIINYFDKNISPKLEFISSYVMDLALVGDDEIPYFIEPNSFGGNYASGSALYHWIYDHDTLHDDDIIEFRYTNEF